MTTAPTYLRVAVTSRCSLACSYCHAEGLRACAGELPQQTLVELILAGVGAGVRKVKLLGGEPLLRRDLPEVIAAVKAEAPWVDLSLITGGAVPPSRLDAAFAAGLDRANLTIHGWTPEAFERKARRPARLWDLRRRTLERLLTWARPIKLNYVYGGPEDEADLSALLDWAADKPVIVGVLDDLGREELGPGVLFEVLRRLRGDLESVRRDEDPDSLDTVHLRWSDGLVVEIKSEHLGRLAPWAACASCPARARCKEGIYAVRIGPDGTLRPCMDRPDLHWPLLPALQAGGRAAVLEEWRAQVETALAAPSAPVGQRATVREPVVSASIG